MTIVTQLPETFSGGTHLDSRLWRVGFAPAMVSSVAAACLSVLTATWIVVAAASTGFFESEGLAIGRVGTFILLSGLLPAVAALVGVAVGLATARHRAAAPELAVLALFVTSIGAHEAASGLSYLMFLAAPSGEPLAPRSLIELARALGGLAGFFAVVSFVRLTTVYGSEFQRSVPDLEGLYSRVLDFVWRRLGTRWVWLLLLLSLLGSIALDSRGSLSFSGWAYSPFYLVLALCGLRLWTSSRVADEEVRVRGGWLVHGAIAFLLGFMFRDLVRAWFPTAVHLWSLPSSMGTLFAVVAVAYAVFWRGVAGPSLVVRMGSLYGALGAVGIFLFAGLEEFLTGWVVGTLGLPERMGTIGAAGIVAVAFAYVQSRLRRDAQFGSPRSAEPGSERAADSDYVPVWPSGTM